MVNYAAGSNRGRPGSHTGLVPLAQRWAIRVLLTTGIAATLTLCSVAFASPRAAAAASDFSGTYTVTAKVPDQGSLCAGVFPQTMTVVATDTTLTIDAGHGPMSGPFAEGSFHITGTTTPQTMVGGFVAAGAENILDQGNYSVAVSAPGSQTIAQTCSWDFTGRATSNRAAAGPPEAAAPAPVPLPAPVAPPLDQTPPQVDQTPPTVDQPKPPQVAPPAPTLGVPAPPDSTAPGGGDSGGSGGITPLVVLLGAGAVGAAVIAARRWTPASSPPDSPTTQPEPPQEPPGPPPLTPEQSSLVAQQQHDCQAASTAGSTFDYWQQKLDADKARNRELGQQIKDEVDWLENMVIWYEIGRFSFAGTVGSLTALGTVLGFGFTAVEGGLVAVLKGAVASDAVKMFTINYGLIVGGTDIFMNPRNQFGDLDTEARKRLSDGLKAIEARFGPQLETAKADIEADRLALEEARGRAMDLISHVFTAEAKLVEQGVPFTPCTNLGVLNLHVGYDGSR
jgi:hypothetical protein